ncbi:hypothetical protein K430107D3_08390 [Dysosmobacter welbionis]
MEKSSNSYKDLWQKDHVRFESPARELWVCMRKTLMRQPACLFSWPARRMESGKTKKGSVTPNETSDLERLDIVPVRLLAAVRCRQRDWKHTAGRGEPRGLCRRPV